MLCGMVRCLAVARAVRVRAALLALAVVCAVLGGAAAELEVAGGGGGDGDGEVVLLSYGEEERRVTVLRRGGAAVVRAEVVGGGGDGLWVAGEAEGGGVAAGDGGWVNYTLPFVFEQGVGVGEWVFEVEDEEGAVERVAGRWVVAGVVVKRGGGVVSGIGRESVSVGTWAEVAARRVVEFEVDAVGADGAELADLRGVSVAVVDKNGQAYEQVESAELAGGRLVLTFASYRVGSGELVVEIDAPGIAAGGEAFETTLALHFDGAGGVPPPVVVPERVANGRDGYATVPMYNLLSPPAAADVEKCVLTIGGAEVAHSVEKSSLVQPDQKIVFKVDGATGPASVVCDGREATVLGGNGESAFDVPEPGSGPAGAGGGRAGAEDAEGEGEAEAGYGAGVNATLAANSLEPPLEEREGTARLRSRLRVVSADPATYSVNEAADVLEAVCFYTGGSDCSLVRVTKGSAVLDVESYVAEGSEVAAGDKLRDAVERCDFQKRIGVACDEIQLDDSAALAASAATPDGRGSGGEGRGTSALVIGLSAAAGGIALILVVVAAGWIVYRRSAEQAESDFSSSGPLGVPERDESLYQQAIVRDIYGRGDFMGGAPTVAAAEQSRREADARESVPRPPSSSAASSFLSRHTADASSTYSV